MTPVKDDRRKNVKVGASTHAVLTALATQRGWTLAGAVDAAVRDYWQREHDPQGWLESTVLSVAEGLRDALDAAVQRRARELPELDGQTLKLRGR